VATCYPLASDVIASRHVVRTKQDGFRVPSVSLMPCDIPLPHEFGDDSFKHSGINADAWRCQCLSRRKLVAGPSGKSNELWDMGSRSVGGGSIFVRFEPQLGRELLYANQPRSWDPMVEEAAMCAASHNSQEEVAAISEQLAKEPLKMNIRSGSSTPLQAAMFPRVVVDHHPPSKDIQIQSPVMFRSEAELLIGYKLIKALSIFKHSLVTPLLLSTQQNISLEKRAFVVHQGGNQSCSQQRKIKIKF
jgi:hypothetical protein